MPTLNESYVKYWRRSDVATRLAAGVLHRRPVAAEQSNRASLASRCWRRRSTERSKLKFAPTRLLRLPREIGWSRMAFPFREAEKQPAVSKQRGWSWWWPASNSTPRGCSRLSSVRELMSRFRWKRTSLRQWMVSRRNCVTPRRESCSWRIASKQRFASPIDRTGSARSRHLASETYRKRSTPWGQTCSSLIRRAEVCSIWSATDAR